MARIGRPLFKRSMTFVAIRPVRIASGVTIDVGEKVELPSYRLRALYQRRRIGPEGHPWTEQAIKSKGFPKAFTSDQEESRQNAAQAQKSAAPAVGGSNPAGSAPSAADSAPVPEKIGSQWGVPSLTDKKFKTKKAAAKWIESRSN